MEILHNVPNVTLPIRVELEFEPGSSKYEYPCSIHLPSIRKKGREFSALLSAGVLLTRNNQVLTREHEEMVPPALTRT